MQANRDPPCVAGGKPPLGPGMLVRAKGVAPPRVVDSNIDETLLFCVMLKRNSLVCIVVIKFVAPTVKPRTLMFWVCLMARTYADWFDGLSAYRPKILNLSLKL